MDELLKLLENDPALLALNDHKQGLSSLNEIEETLLIAGSFKSKPRNIVVIKNNSYTAQQLANRLYPLLKDDVLLFVQEESLRVEAVAASPTIYANQINVLSSLCLSNKPKVIITNPMGIMRYLPEKSVFESHILNLKVNQIFNMQQLSNILVTAGYRQSPRVDQPLTFSLRGSIIDVFSIQDENPTRIEFFDDEIDSIRTFEISSQRTIERKDESTIVPASTLIYDEDFSEIKNNVYAILQKNKDKAENYNELKENIDADLAYIEKKICEHYLYRYRTFFKNNVSLLEYVKDPDVIESTVEDISNNIQFILDDNYRYIQELFLDNRGLNYDSVFADYDLIVAKYKPNKIYSIANYKETIKSQIKLTYFPLLPLDKAIEEIINLSKNNKIYTALNSTQYDILKAGFKEANKDADQYVTNIAEDLEEGFNYQDCIVLTGKELFGLKMVHGRYENKFKEASVLDSYQDLKIGDYVVHNQYGIGRYDGIITKEVRGKQKDFLQVRYKDEDLLLVPLEQFKLVRKFVCAEGTNVRLNKLGSNSWNKAKEKISSEVNDIAQRLVKLYAEREENIGFAFSKDDDYSRQFENNFPYQLTADQQKAIAEVKYDMEQSRPMDRLLCGDVGFGKTEVAMVAAFKAAKDLKQVAYLCPTTILSRQHYYTFIERFKGFPIKIALLNRYVPEAAQNEILSEVAQGKIDILIGTHRILSNDIKFADLGLLIIDEEQRFGVQAKEKIKELKKTIDVLSLSATPIPRTLQMSLVGVMALSQLQTPPNNRTAIQTYVVEKNDSLIKETIQRELARNGQVFYLHNNVSTIYETARKIQALVPQANIAIGHGQMNRDELEDVMYRFIDGEYNVLICTTIIETGIDIPNANTIIIEGSENFGLSQLYQIRGRVGRSDRIAYAYLMYSNHRSLSEVASKRLQAIKDFTELGSGYKVAMRDLTIRGAGDLLGERQAGFINTVGMSLYLDMLNKAINYQKGISEEIIEENQIHSNDVDGYIPSEFVNRDYEKIGIYQQLATINNRKALDEYQEKITDYYGKLPKTISNLFEKKQIELLLNNKKIDRYVQLDKENKIVLTEKTSSGIDGVKFFSDISQISNTIKLSYNNNMISLIIPKSKKYQELIIKVLEVIDNL